MEKTNLYIEETNKAIKLFFELDRKIDNFIQGYTIYKLFEMRIKHILENSSSKEKEVIEEVTNVLDKVFQKFNRIF